MPAHFDNWSTALRRFRDWREADVFKRVFDACSDEPDMKHAMVDATIMKVSPPWAGRKRGTQSQAIGCAKGGMATKILVLTDTLGNLVRFQLLPGHRFDTVGIPPLLNGVEFGGLIADKAYDSDAILADLNARGAKVVISQHPRRIGVQPIDRDLYKWRHLIESFFCKLNDFKRIAMRAGKTDPSFSAMLHLAVAIINSR